MPVVDRQVIATPTWKPTDEGVPLTVGGHGTPVVVSGQLVGVGDHGVVGLVVAGLATPDPEEVDQGAPEAPPHEAVGDKVEFYIENEVENTGITWLRDQS